MLASSRDALTVNNMQLSSSLDLLSPTKINSLNSLKSEEIINEIANKHLTLQENILSDQELKIENRTTVMQLKLLFETRYNQPGRWPKVSSTEHVYFDCEGLAHYLMTGKIGRFEKIEIPNINKVDLKKEHKPYTCYKIWQPRAPWAREELGFWGGVHYFTHLENGEYISKNGCGPIRFFHSFEEMLKKDAFPFGFITEDYKDANGIEQAMIGESIIGTIH